MKLVSIVLPLYNSEKYLTATIDSILSQCYNNLEIVISDDNSHDSTINIVNSYNDSRIKFVINNNKPGIFSNLNNAIKQSSGDFIQIFCHDDVMPQEFISNQLNMFEEYKELGMVFSDVKIIDDSGEKFELEDAYKYRKNWPEIFPINTIMNYFMVYGCMPGNLSPVMLKRKTIVEVGQFKSEFTYGGDFDYWVRVAEKFLIGFNKNNYVFIRRHLKQASKTLIDSNFELFNETGYIYAKLINSAFNCEKKTFLSWFFNQNIGISYFDIILKQIINFNTRKLKDGISYLNRYPFNLFKIILLYGLTFRKRFPLFRIKV